MIDLKDLNMTTNDYKALTGMDISLDGLRLELWEYKTITGEIIVDEMHREYLNGKKRIEDTVVEKDLFSI